MSDGRTDMRLLRMLVFTVGAATLGAEIAAARLMAPFFGASTIVWANTIATVLVALSIGYWLGGRLADKRPHLDRLARWVLVASVILACVPFVADPFLDLSVSAFDNIDVGAAIGSLVGVLALVAVPVLMLGVTSPWAIRLSVDRVEDAGRAAGSLYALSTVGSLLGTFLAALVLVPLVGTQRTFLIFAAAVGLVAALALPRRHLLVPVAIGAALLVPAGTTKPADGVRVLEERETPDQYARVIELPDGERRLELNEGQAFHSVWRPDSVLTDNVWDGYLSRARQRARPPAALAGHPRQRRRHDGARLRGVLPRHADRRRGDRRRADRAGRSGGSACATGRASSSTRRTPGRSCGGPRSAGRRSWSTPTASPTSRST